MAKPKVKKELVPAPLADAKWINTPFAFARLVKDQTLLQQSVLMMVSDKLQDYIADFFASHRNMSPDDPNCLFPPEVVKDVPAIEISLADFGMGATRNQEIHDAAMSMAQLVIYAPSINEDGTPGGYDYLPVFDKVNVPKLDASDPERKFNQRVGYITAHINHNVAAYAFNMRLGYINHPMRIASSAAQVYSPRIYFLIKHYMVRWKKTVTIPYRKLREELGMINYDAKTHEQIGETYPQFSRFKMYVLDPAKADLDRMAKLNLIDITFTYVPMYKQSVQRGDPESIVFTIEQTDLGKFHRGGDKAKAELTTEAKRRPGRPRKQSSTDTTPSLFEPTPETVLDQLDTEFGHDSYGDLFGTRCRCEIADKTVTLYVPSSRVSVITLSDNHQHRIAKAIADSIGEGYSVEIKSL